MRKTILSVGFFVIVFVIIGVIWKEDIIYWYTHNFEENNYSELNVQIKLRLPSIFKTKYDPNNEYEGFYLNVMSDKLISVISTSHLERTRDSGLQPITSWEEYVMGLYQQFKEKQRKQQI